MSGGAWRVAFGFLTAVFVLTAALNLAHVKAGFLTSYAADLCVPAWLYIGSRHLAGGRRRTSVMGWLGRTPELAAASLFAASALTELSQLRWPRGLFAGTFDAFDLAAFALGLLPCYVADKLSAGR